jgi:deazaflavin-dependent oxidoreductase (nitroreductase family)
VSSDPAGAPYLYLTTVGRNSGLPRQIEIWFVAVGDRLYLLAEHGRRAQWVKNINRHARVGVRLGSRNAAEFEAVARVLDRGRDAGAWERAQELFRQKYGWGDGLPVEITPASAR